MEPTTMHTDYLAHLAQDAADQLTALAYEPTVTEMLEGALVFDSRNLPAGTVCSMARKGYLVKFGSPMQGVQYWTLTEAGFDAVRLTWWSKPCR